MDYIKQLTGKTDEEIISELGDSIYKNPETNLQELAEEYLSGNVREKLAIAREAAKTNPIFLRNVKALEEIQPVDLTENEIDIFLGSSWVDTKYYEDFAESITDRSVTIERFSGRYVILGERDDVRTLAQWTISRQKTPLLFYDLLEYAMNRIYPTIKIKDSKGNEYTDQEKTALAREKIDELKAKFDEWIWKNEERKKDLLKTYNERFNSLVQRKYDGSHLTFPNLSKTIKLYPHQKDAVWRIMQGGNTLLAHTVGAGKTFEMLVAGQELKRIGKIRKPIFVVPNNIVEQFTQDARKVDPNAKILVLDSKNLPAAKVDIDFDEKIQTKEIKRNPFEKKSVQKETPQQKEIRLAKRRATLSRIATVDWDFIIMSHETFASLPMSPEYYQQFYQEQIDQLEEYKRRLFAKAEQNYRAQRKRGIKAQKPSKKRFEKNLEIAIANLKEKLTRDIDEAKKETVMPFEQLGIDQIFVDECDLFKNLRFITSHGDVSNVNTTGSKRALDMYAKTRWLTKQRNGGGVVFASGTPVSNSFNEIFTLQRYLDHNTLKKETMTMFDDWAGTFGDFSTSYESSASGGIKKVTRIVIKNIQALYKFFSRFADYKSADMLPHLKRPKLKGKDHTRITVKPSQALLDFMAEISERAKNLLKGNVDPKEDNMLKITTEMRKAAFDMRLIDPSLSGAEVGGKIEAFCDTAFNKYKETESVKGTQVAFLDFGIPKISSEEINDENANEDTEEELSAADVSMYEIIKKGLIKRGIPANQIAFVHDAKNKDQLQKLFDKVNEGEIRIILGSTPKMGAGTNFQKHLVALHHLDCPWRPRDIEQREGRILRNGNLNEEVEIFTYLTEDSGDAFMWTKIKNKAEMISSFWKGNTNANITELADDDLSLKAGEAILLTNHDPLTQELTQVEQDLRLLKIQQSAYINNQIINQEKKNKLEKEIPADEYRVKNLKADVAEKTNTQGDAFKMKIGDTVYTDRPKAKAALADLLKNFQNKMPKKIGEIGGFNLKAQAVVSYTSNSGGIQSQVQKIVFKVQNHGTYGVGDSLQTVENFINKGIEHDLAESEKSLSDKKNELAEIEKEIAKPFKYTKELREAEMKFTTIQAKINGKDTVIETAAVKNAPAETANTNSNENEEEIENDAEKSEVKNTESEKDINSYSEIEKKFPKVTYEETSNNKGYFAIDGQRVSSSEASEVADEISNAKSKFIFDAVEKNLGIKSEAKDYLPYENRLEFSFNTPENTIISNNVRRLESLEDAVKAARYIKENFDISFVDVKIGGGGRFAPVVFRINEDGEEEFRNDEIKERIENIDAENKESEVDSERLNRINEKISQYFESPQESQKFLIQTLKEFDDNFANKIGLTDNRRLLEANVHMEAARRLFREYKKSQEWIKENIDAITNAIVQDYYDQRENKVNAGTKLSDNAKKVIQDKVSKVENTESDNDVEESVIEPEKDSNENIFEISTTNTGNRKYPTVVIKKELPNTDELKSIAQKYNGVWKKFKYGNDGKIDGVIFNTKKDLNNFVNELKEIISNDTENNSKISLNSTDNEKVLTWNDLSDEEKYRRGNIFADYKNLKIDQQTKDTLHKSYPEIADFIDELSDIAQTPPTGNRKQDKITENAKKMLAAYLKYESLFSKEGKFGRATRDMFEIWESQKIYAANKPSQKSLSIQANAKNIFINLSNNDISTAEAYEEMKKVLGKKYKEASKKSDEKISETEQRLENIRKKHADVAVVNVAGEDAIFPRYAYSVDGREVERETAQEIAFKQSDEEIQVLFDDFMRESGVVGVKDKKEGYVVSVNHHSLGSDTGRDFEDHTFSPVFEKLEDAIACARYVYQNFYKLKPGYKYAAICEEGEKYLNFIATIDENGTEKLERNVSQEDVQKYNDAVAKLENEEKNSKRGNTENLPANVQEENLSDEEVENRADELLRSLKIDGKHQKIDTPIEIQLLDNPCRVVIHDPSEKVSNTLLVFHEQFKGSSFTGETDTPTFYIDGNTKFNELAIKFNDDFDRQTFLKMAEKYLFVDDSKTLKLIDSPKDNSKFSVRDNIETKMDKILAPEELDNKQKATAEFAKKMGVPVIYFKGNKKFHGAHSNGITYINVDSETSHDWIFWHESFHWLAKNNPALFNEVAKAVNISQKQIDDYKKEIGRQNLTDAEVIEEILADNMKDVASRAGLLQEIGKKNKSLVQRLISWFKSVIDKFTDFFNTPINGLTREQKNKMYDAFGKMVRSITDEDGNAIFRFNKRTKEIELSNGNALPQVQFSMRGNSKNVVKVTGDEFGDYADIKELRKKAINYYRENLQGTSVFNAELGRIDIDENGLVEFTGEGRDKVRSNSAQEDTLFLVKYLPSLISNSEKIAYKKAVSEKHIKAGDSFYYLQTQYKKGDKIIPLGITLKKLHTGDIHYYNHVINPDAKKAPVSPGTESSKEVNVSPAVGTFFNETISQNENNGNTKYSFEGKIMTATDDKYFKAVEAFQNAKSDSEKQSAYEKLQKMVQQAAEEAGFNNAVPEQTVAYKVRTTAAPKKSIKVYKVFTVANDGSPTALFIGGTEKLPQGVWLDAQSAYHFTAKNGLEYVPSTQNPFTKGGKTGASVEIPNEKIRQELIERGFLPKGSTATKITALAYRPGWHAGTLPFFPQGGMKPPKGTKTNYDNIHRYNQVVFECELAAEKDYTAEAEAQPKARNKDGSLNTRKADLQYMPKNGFYYYATNPMTHGHPELGMWVLSGSLKINRALTQEECDKILQKNNMLPQEWEQGKMNLADLGYTGEQNDAARKTLAPITYDDDGNIIPLSQRFNADKDDIRYSINNNDNSVTAFAKKIGHKFFGERNERIRKQMKEALEELTGYKISSGHLASENGNIAVKNNAKVIRTQSAYDWENILPEVGKLVAEKLKLTPTAEMNNYIADWIIDGAINNTSAESKEFQRAMQNADNEYREKLLDAQNKFIEWNNKSAMEKVQAIVSSERDQKSFGEKLKSNRQTLYDQFIEDIAPVKRLVDEIEKESGKKIPESLNPYVAFRNYKGMAGRARMMLEGNEKAVKVLQETYKNIDFSNFKTLQMILDEVGATKDDKIYEEFKAYVTACHVKEIHDKNKQIDKAIEKRQEKIDAEEDLLNNATGKRQIAEIEKRIQFHKDKIAKLKESKYVTPFDEKTCDEIISKNKNRYGKSQKDLVHYSNIMLAIIQDSGIRSKTAYDELLKKWKDYVPLHRIFDENENLSYGDSLKTMEGSARDIIDPIQSIIASTNSFIKRAEKNKAKILLAGLVRCNGVGRLIEEVDGKKPDDHTTITFYEDGVKKYLQTDESVVYAVNNMTTPQMNWFAKFLRIGTNLLRNLVTVYNPNFAIRNMARDIQDAYVYSNGKNKSLVEAVTDIVQTPLYTIKGIMSAYHKDEDFNEWMIHGGAQASFWSMDRDYTQVSIDKLTRKQKKNLSMYQRIRDGGAQFLNLMSAFGEYSELGTRIGHYKKIKDILAKEHGGQNTYNDLVVAAYESRDLMDFARGGAASRSWNALTAFANANLQGIDKFCRTFNPAKLKTEEGRKEFGYSVLRLMISSVLPALFLFILNHDEDWYKNDLNDWERRSHWILGENFRVPKGMDFGVRFMSNLTEDALNWMYNNKPMEFKKTFVEPVFETLPDLLPTALQPIIESMANYDLFTKNPIVPRRLESLPEHLQYDDRTLGIAKYLGEITDYSPKKIEHIITGFTGNMGKGFFRAADVVVGDKKASLPPIDWIPIVGGFFRIPYRNPKIINDYYEQLDNQTKLHNEFKATGKKPEGYDENLFNRFKKIQKEMQKFSKLERAAVENLNLDNEEKDRRQIAIQKKRIALVEKVMR